MKLTLKVLTVYVSDLAVEDLFGSSVFLSLLTMLTMQKRAALKLLPRVVKPPKRRGADAYSLEDN